MKPFRPSTTSLLKDSWPVWVGVAACAITALSLFGAHLKGTRLISPTSTIPSQLSAEEAVQKESSSSPGWGEERTAVPTGHSGIPKVALNPAEGSRVGVAAIGNGTKTSGTPGEAQTSEGVPVSDLRKKTADWRYEGFLESAQGNRAVVRRMQNPSGRALLKEGDLLEGVLIESIDGDRLVARQGDETRSIPLTTRAAFDLSDLVIPTELSDMPESLAATVFSQTLGPYLEGVPQADWLVEASSDESETLETVSRASGLPSTRVGETAEQWAIRLGEDLASGGAAGSLPNPMSVPLTEEVRLRFLGVR